MPDLPVTEAVVAGAIAAQAAESSGHPGPLHTHCENCGTALSGPYCHRCGQHDFAFHRSFGHVFLEALENFFHFDSKLFHNIVTLLFSPGRLTAEFNAGRRASQMPPFRLYLFVSVLFFFVSFLGGSHEARPALNLHFQKPGPMVTADQPAQPTDEMRQAFAEAASDIAREIKDPKKAEQARAALEKIHQATGQNPQAISAAVKEIITQQVNEAKKSKEWNNGTKRDSSAFVDELNERGKRVVKNPGEFIESFKHSISKLLLVCLPFFALYTRVLFRKSGQVYLQHLIVALHFHTFVYLWWLVARGWYELIGLWSPGFAGLLGFLTGLWMFVYPFRMLHRLFGQSWTKIIIKTFLLAGIYAFTLGLALLATAAIIFFSV